jgi:Protein of unknown function (DUF2474)
MRASAGSPSRTWFVRLAWLVVFWLSGVAGMGLAAMVLRTVMRAIGLA